MWTNSKLFDHIVDCIKIDVYPYKKAWWEIFSWSTQEWGIVLPCYGIIYVLSLSYLMIPIGTAQFFSTRSCSDMAEKTFYLCERKTTLSFLVYEEGLSPRWASCVDDINGSVECLYWLRSQIFWYLLGLYHLLPVVF